MIFLFYFVYVLSALYFLGKNRYFDFYTISFIGFSFYFLPGFFGEVAYLSNSGWVYTPIHPLTYTVMISIVMSITLLAVFSDKYYCRSMIQKNNFSHSKLRLYLNILIFVSGATLALAVLTSSGSIFNPNKSEVMGNLNRWHIFFTTASTIGFPVSMLSKQKKYIIIFLTFLLINAYIGFRSPLVISVLTSCVVGFYGRRFRLFTLYKFSLIFALFILCMFLYKYIGFILKAGMWDLVLERLFTLDTYSKMLMWSEPFLILNTLNAVVIHDYQTDAKHVYSTIYSFILFAPELGAEIKSFNDYFQPDLFGSLDYGMASNIWAQFYSAFSWMGVVLMIFMFCFILLLSNYALRKSSYINLALFSPIYVYFAFYIHRNDLGYAITLSKRLFLICVILVLLAKLIPFKAVSFSKENRH
jgi:hypothetical protein